MSREDRRGRGATPLQPLVKTHAPSTAGKPARRPVNATKWGQFGAVAMAALVVGAP